MQGSPLQVHQNVCSACHHRLPCLAARLLRRIVTYGAPFEAHAQLPPDQEVLGGLQREWEAALLGAKSRGRAAEQLRADLRAIDLARTRARSPPPPGLDNPSPIGDARSLSDADTAAIDEHIADLLASGNAIEVEPRTDTPPAPVFMVRGTAWKSHGNTLRSDTDDSKKLRLVISLVDQNRSLQPSPPFSYDSLDNFLLRLAQGSWISVYDCDAAYHSIPVSTESARWVTFTWRGKHYKALTLPFGARFSPIYFCFISSHISETVRVHARTWPAMYAAILQYSDDGACGTQTELGTYEALLVALLAIHKLGLKIKRSKLKLPATSQDLLGCTVGTTPLVHVRITPQKTARVRQLLDEFQKVVMRGDAYVPHKALRTLAGYMQYAAWCIPGGFTRRRGFHAAVTASTGKYPMRNPMANLEMAARHFQFMLDRFPQQETAITGTILPVHSSAFGDAQEPVKRSRPLLRGFSDASDATVAYYNIGDDYITVECLPSELIGASSCARELYGVLMGLRRCLLRHQYAATIRWSCDNSGTLFALLKGSAHVPDYVQRKLEAVHDQVRKQDCTIEVEWRQRDNPYVAVCDSAGKHTDSQFLLFAGSLSCDIPRTRTLSRRAKRVLQERWLSADASLHGH